MTDLSILHKMDLGKKYERITAANRWEAFKSEMKILMVIFLIAVNISVCSQNVAWDTAFTVEGSEFMIRGLFEDHTLEIWKGNELLISEKHVTAGADLVFFNDDQYPDILTIKMGNNPVYGLYLYDPIKRRYELVEGIDRFGDPKRLPASSDLYFSYRRAGCADNNWQSQLFKIVDYKSQIIGYMFGTGCEWSEEELGIRMYKIHGEREIPIDSLPIDTIVNTEGFKWGLIEKYWTENSEKFE
jgi:hypothetical protein